MRSLRWGRGGLMAFVCLCVVAPGLARAATPTVVVSPTSGSPGRGLTVTGTNWTPGDTIFVQIGSTTFDTDVVCVLTAGPDGTIAGTKPNGNCQVPNVPAGSQTLVAIDQQNQSVRATGTFTVVAGLVLTPSNASAGTPASPGATITMLGHGFASGSTVSGFKFDTAALTTSPTSMSTDAGGNFSSGVSFTVPATTAGTHTVSGTDGSGHKATATVTIFTPTVSVSPTSGAPGRGLTVSGGGWPAGDSVFVQIGSGTFDADVVCVLTASPDGTIGGTKPNGNCQVPNVPAGSRSLVAIDQQKQGVEAFGTAFPVVPGLTLIPSGAAAGTPASPGATITIQGSGFAGGSTVSAFKFDAAALAASPASVGTDASGNFSGPVTFTVPTTAAGTHTVFATDGSANKGSGTLKIFTPKISVSPASGSPGRGLAVSGSGWPAGDNVFVQIGSSAFDVDVACVLTAASDGVISGTKPNGNCQVPNVPAGSRSLVAIDQQNQGVLAIGTPFPVVAGLTLTPNGAAAGTPVSPGATVTLTGAGFASGSTVSAFKFDTSALVTTPTSMSTDASGNFSSSVSFTVPATTAGTHTVFATDGSANKGSGRVTVFTPTIRVSPTSGSPGRGLTVTGGGWPAGDNVFVQIGSSTFDVNVVCVLTAGTDGTISGTKSNGNCQLPSVPAGSRALVAIDQQNQGVLAIGTPFPIVAGLTLTPSGAAAGSAASPGALVTVQGAGFAGGSTVSAFKFDAAALAASPGSIGTDASGNFTGPVTFTVPTTTAGTHTVSATDGSANKGSGTLKIFAPKISVTPASGAPGAGLTVSGSGWPAGDNVFVQIGSITFDADVVCVLTASEDGTIAGNKPNGNCQVPGVSTGPQTLFAIDQQNQGVLATGTKFNVT